MKFGMYDQRYPIKHRIHNSLGRTKLGSSSLLEKIGPQFVAQRQPYDAYRLVVNVTRTRIVESLKLRQYGAIQMCILD